MTAISREVAQTRPWTGNYPDGIDYFAPLDFTPVYQQVLAMCAKVPDVNALDIFGAKTTYGELGRDIKLMAGALQKDLGLKKGDRLGLLLPNCPQFPVIYYAAHSIGVTVVNCNPLYTVDELAHMIKDADVDILVTVNLQALFSKVEELMDRDIVRRMIICDFVSELPMAKEVLFKLFKRKDMANPSKSKHSAHFHYWNGLLAKNLTADPVVIDPETDIAVIQYTGGTTGLPKGAQLSHKNLSANLAQIKMWGVDLFSPRSKVIAVLPFFHIFAMTVCMNVPLAVGMEIVMLPRFEMGQMLALIKRMRPNILPAVPTLTHALVTGKASQKADLTSLEVCISGGAPIAMETREQFEKVTGGVVGEGYGLSETAPVLTCSPLYAGMKNNSIGMPMPGTDISFRDLDDPSKEVPQGEWGEIVAKGPQVMLAYLNNPDANEASFIDGYFRTGDVGYVDEDGHIFLVDRIKDLIICSGYNVYPRNIEDALYGISEVDECIVFGTEDGYRGEAPIAFVKFHTGMSLSEADVRAALAQKISKIEMPREIHFRDELPKTFIGKLSKKDLKAEYEAAKASADKNGKATDLS